MYFKKSRLDALIDGIERNIEEEEKVVHEYVIKIRIQLILCKTLLALVLAIRERESK